MIQVIDKMYQSNGINVKYSCGLGVVAYHGWITGDGQDIFNSHGAGSQ